MVRAFGCLRSLQPLAAGYMGENPIEVQSPPRLWIDGVFELCLDPPYIEPVHRPGNDVAAEDVSAIVFVEVERQQLIRFGQDGVDGIPAEHGPGEQVAHVPHRHAQVAHRPRGGERSTSRSSGGLGTLVEREQPTHIRLGAEGRLDVTFALRDRRVRP